MIFLRNVPDPHAVRVGDQTEASFRAIIDDMAWQFLGVNGEEFRRRWYGGEMPTSGVM